MRTLTMIRFIFIITLSFNVVTPSTVPKICLGDTFYTQEEFMKGIAGPALMGPTNRECDYCALSASNTYCQFQNNPGPSGSCGDSSQVTAGISDDERQEILDVHNDYRRRVAKGEEPNMPSRIATNMMKLTWSEELAEGAQLWANQCIFQHDSANTCTYDWVGQNLFTSGSMGSDSTPEWNRGISAWYDEVVDFQDSSVSSFQPPSGAVTGHFTQIIWATTHEIGCGYIVYPQGTMLQKSYVCNYGPGGNRLNTPIFLTDGDLCSACPSGTQCEDGLCAPAAASALDDDTEADPGKMEV